MSENLIQIKAFLGKYYQELLSSSTQDKYKNTKLDTFFEQRFLIQNNKVQMIVDPAITGLIVLVSGNEIRVSQAIFDHPGIIIKNSLEHNMATNPKNLYNPEVFSTLAYLVCQNHTTFQIVGEIDEPIYVKYTADYETFYNSVIVFNIADGLEAEIIEEIESFSALNAVTNYIINPRARLNLSTFYQNNISGLSFYFRNIIARENAYFNHILFGKGSSNVIDENKIYTLGGSKCELFGLVSSDGRNFHSILYIEPDTLEYYVSVNYKEILEGNAKVTFFPVLLGNVPDDGSATINVSNITVEDIPVDEVEDEIENFTADIIGRATLDRMVGSTRFYDNKHRFIHLL